MKHQLYIKNLLRITLIVNLLLTGVPGAFSQTWQWAARVGGVGGLSSDNPNESVLDMQTDAQGNVYVCGRIGHNANFNGQPLTTWPNVGYNIFLAKLDCNGNLVWVRTAGGTHPDNEARGLALDGQGHLYLTGRASAVDGLYTLNFFDTLITETCSDLFLAKFDTSGNFHWVTVAAPGPATLQSRGRSIAIDSQGMINITGFGSLTGLLFPGYMFTPSWLFVARFDTSGQINRLLDLGGAAYGVIGFNDFKINADGDHYVTGYFSSDSALIGTQMLYRHPPLTGTKPDLFLAKFDSAGIFQWVLHIGYFHIMRGHGIGFLGNDIILTGRAADSVTIGTTLITNPLDDNSSFPFVARISPTGNVLWATGIQNATAGSTPANGVAIKTSGNSVIAGEFSVMAVIGNDTLTANNIQDIFLAEIDPNGNFVASSKINGTGSDEVPLCITSDTNDNVYIGGGFDGTLTVNGTPYTSAGGNSDGFVAKFGAPCAVGLSETQGDAGQPLIVYPNPVTSRLNVTLPDRHQLSELTIVDLSGATVMRKSINNHTSGDVSIDVSSLSCGFYILMAHSKSGVKAAKFIKWLNQ